MKPISLKKAFFIFEILLPVFTPAPASPPTKSWGGEYLARWKRWTLTLCLILCISQAAVWAQAEGTAGQAAPYLREGVGARALGMGNANTAAVSDATAAYWNPAALVSLENWGIGSQTAVLGENRSWNFLNGYRTFNPKGKYLYSVGLSWINYSAGDDLERRTSNRPDPENTFGSSENVLMGSLATRVGAKVSVGTNVKLLMQNLDNETVSGLGWDFAIWQDLGPVVWGVTWQDAYSYLDWGGRFTERLPANWRVGAAWQILDKQLLATADGNLEYSPTRGAQTPGYHLGVEYLPWEWLAVRAGVDQGRPAGGLGFRFALGSLAWARVDYALTAEQLPGAGLMHFFSLSADFRNKRPAPSVPGLE